MRDGRLGYRVKPVFKRIFVPLFAVIRHKTQGNQPLHRRSDGVGKFFAEFFKNLGRLFVCPINALSAASARLAEEAKRYEKLDLPADLRRKLQQNVVSESTQ